jgi:hypothetical protein
MTNPKIAPWQAVFRTIDESGYRFILGVAVLLFADTAMNARDLGQWDDPANAELKNWYQALKQPDNPAATCCGEADAYWADAFEATSDGS